MKKRNEIEKSELLFSVSFCVKPFGQGTIVLFFVSNTPYAGLKATYVSDLVIDTACFDFHGNDK